MTDIDAIFSEYGPLGTNLDHYSPRAAQIEMAKAVQHAIEEDDTVIIEAGTGTGKTFAYLIPALLSGKKVIVSTGTKHLQDQLYEKDLPLLKKLFKHVPVQTALLKGRSNYLCLYRIKTMRQRGRFENKKQLEAFYDIERYAGQDPIGDVTKIENCNDHSLISHVTSTSESCLHSECPDYEECFVFKARKKAMDADIIVINHHLFCADLALKQEGFGELLPEADTIIIDEAHQLAEIAGVFFSEQVGTKPFLDWLEDFNRTIAVEANDFSAHDTLTDAIRESMIGLRKSLPEGSRRYALSEFYQDPKIATQLAHISDQLLDLVGIIKPLLIRSKPLAQMVERAEAFHDAWTRIAINSQENPDDNTVVWLETYAHHLTIAATPLDISEIFQRNSEGLKAGWVFTSATLAVNGKFSYFCGPLGLSDQNTLCLKSPFNYKYNALFYHPESLPEPNHPTYIEKFIDAMLPVITAAKGRTFILFTSYRALNEAAKLLKNLVSYPLFIQGDAPKITLIDQFRESGNGILLGTTSFWEGVDVRGEALSCVIIEKLPFASPGDPIEQAKIDLINKKGLNAFMTYQLPKSIITLKQGVGRLIRDTQDYGLLVIADPRLVTKNYGKQFLASLPEMAKTQKIERVEKFFEYVDKKRLE
ncbi:ATP-dependent DNA helicase [Wohlfahrtiimonas chitiniclastica]|uniref:ATP-dependent DNA helicase n=1 Tax=Wohlfahrtiimonas chitiniclastica TaxID=400946 RepID=UPI001BD15F70|nr:ATP-dependent DNA helicase [Wohlfahrtiimonas chitiniclastica]MBS7834427.1 ATP-dependent DNA helicase [Wohlfahrtiimonas chitiniclastica]